MRAIVIVFFLQASASLFCQNFVEVVGRHLINNNYDSVLYYLHRVDDQDFVKKILKITYNRARPTQVFEIYDDINLSGTWEHQKFDRFLKDKIDEPKLRDEVYLDYVKFKNFHIGILAIELELRDAHVEHDKLNKYLSSIQNKSSEEYKLAILHSEFFNALMYLIQHDTH